MGGRNLDGAFLPDSARARNYWNAVRARFAIATRLSCGHDLSDHVSDELFAQLDMLSRWEVRMRGKYYGTWPGKLADLDYFRV
jgi:hypothetical protein